MPVGRQGDTLSAECVVPCRLRLAPSRGPGHLCRRRKRAGSSGRRVQRGAAGTLGGPSAAPPRPGPVPAGGPRCPAGARTGSRCRRRAPHTFSFPARGRGAQSPFRGDFPALTHAASRGDSGRRAPAAPPPTPGRAGPERGRWRAGAGGGRRRGAPGPRPSGSCRETSVGRKKSPPRSGPREVCRARWCAPVMPALGRLRQEGGGLS